MMVDIEGNLVCKKFYKGIEKKIKVTDVKTGLLFEFDTHEEKEIFFDLWDKYEVVEK